MTAFQKIAAGIAVAMVITALALPGRSSQEAAVLKGFQGLSTGTIKAAEGQ
jgi:hypothetical protein